MTRQAKIIERGNGFPSDGDYVADSEDLYRIVGDLGPIQTTGVRGNWVYAELELVDWCDCDEDDVYPCIVEIED